MSSILSCQSQTECCHMVADTQIWLQAHSCMLDSVCWTSNVLHC